MGPGELDRDWYNVSRTMMSCPGCGRSAWIHHYENDAVKCEHCGFRGVWTGGHTARPVVEGDRK